MDVLLNIPFLYETEGQLASWLAQQLLLWHMWFYLSNVKLKCPEMMESYSTTFHFPQFYSISIYFSGPTKYTVNFYSFEPLKNILWCNNSVTSMHHEFLYFCWNVSLWNAPWIRWLIWQAHRNEKNSEGATNYEILSGWPTKKILHFKSSKTAKKT